MRITFFGGAGGVTGSKHLLETEAGSRVLLDCGTFQGLPDVRARNRGFPFGPDTIDAAVLSHAHIDHCGMLPLLVKRGFAGPIFATEATRDVAARMLADAAKIEEQDATWRARHKVGAPDEREPLFTQDDVEPTVKQFKTIPYARESGDWTQVLDGIQLKQYEAGHILGSAISVLDINDGNSRKRIAYTGDVGAANTPLLRDPAVPEEEVSTVLCESTYGSRVHRPLEEAYQRLAITIKKVIARKGKIIIPAFSLGRTQLIVYVLHKLTDSGRIPRLPIYVDSPLATDLTEIFRSHSDLYDQETVQDFGADDAPLAFRNLTYTNSRNESKALNDLKGPFIVISASGMMTAGRVVHHLRHCIGDKRNAIFVTGYQAAGTTGRRLLEGARRIELLGDWFTVRAETHLFNEFSAHAGSDEMQSFLERWKGLRQVVLVHGEPHQADDFKAQLETAHPDWNVVRPNEGETLEL